MRNTDETANPEKLWWEGFEIGQEARSLEADGHYEESQKLMERAMLLWTQALEHGVQGKSEVTCHWFLGNEFYDKALDLEEHRRLSKEPLDQIPTLFKGVTHLESAIELDAQIGNFVFGNKENQADLLKLDFVWSNQSTYIKHKDGVEAAISYLLNKLKLVQHFRVLLPELFYTLGMHYADANDVSSAMTMLRAAINAEDYGDVLNHEDPRYRIAQITKKNAANNLKYLEVHGRAPIAGESDKTILDPFYIESDDVEGLMKLLEEGLSRKSGQDPVIGAIRRLADLKDRRVIPLLHQALTHSNVTVKTDAALALHKFGDTAGLDTLISWLSSDERLAQRASSVLAKIDDPRALEALQGAKSVQLSSAASSESSSFSPSDISGSPLTTRGWVIIAIGFAVIIVGIIASESGRRVAPPQLPASQQGRTTGTMREVKAVQLNLRSGPGVQHSVVRVLNRGERIVTIGEPQNVNGEQWIQASTPDGQTRGWANQKFLSP